MSLMEFAQKASESEKLQLIATLDENNTRLSRELLSETRQMRFAAAVSAMQGILSNSTRPSSPDMVADHAIACADKLLEKFTINTN